MKQQRKRAGGTVTISDVARKAGVSTATVSRALNDSSLVTETTRAIVAETVRQLGYKPNQVARNLRTRASKMVALLLPDITNPFYPGLIKGVQDTVHSAGYLLVLCTAEGDPAGEEAYLNLLRERLVDGALIDGLVLEPERIVQFSQDGFPLISLDRHVGRDIPMVGTDNVLGGRLATQHLIDLGHRRIGHIAGAPSLQISGERRGAYHQALHDAGIDDQHVVYGDFTEHGGREAMLQLKQAGCTAVFAANDLSAIGALAVAGDVSVVGFDDIPAASYLGLTTVRQPAYEIGRLAAEMLLSTVRGTGGQPRQPTLLEPSLIVRATTRERA